VNESVRIACMDGDGIGPEIVPAARRVADAAVERAGGAPITWVPLPMGAESVAATGRAIPDENFPVLEECEGWVVGPHDSQSYGEAWQRGPDKVPSARLRVKYDLYANIRPARTRPGVPSLRPDIDLVTVRENTQGLYSDRNMHLGDGEFMPTPDTVVSMALFTRPAIRRIAVSAFELAMTRRRRVTIVHKANVMPRSFGLWLEECRDVASQFPAVTVDDVLFDAMAALLVRRPHSFDVLLTENLMGDTLSDLVGELVGGLGCSGSLNAGPRHAMAQAAHGSAPDVAGRGVANPVGMIESTSMLLRWLGGRRHDDALVAASTSIDRAIAQVLEQGVQTPDLGGTAGTDDVTDAMVRAILAD
jgi:3-isopropylmalate dehydrogenase